MNPYNVFEDICESFEETPKQCKKWLQNSDLSDLLPSDGVSGGAVVMIIVIMVILNAILIVVYRKCLDKEIEEEKKMQMSSAISQYVALSQIKEF